MTSRSSRSPLTYAAAGMATTREFVTVAAGTCWTNRTFAPDT